MSSKLEEHNKELTRWGLPVKVMLIDEKDGYDKKMGALVEWGLVSEEDYYRVKKFAIENNISVGE